MRLKDIKEDIEEVKRLSREISALCKQREELKSKISRRFSTDIVEVVWRDNKPYLKITKEFYEETKIEGISKEKATELVKLLIEFYDIKYHDILKKTDIHYNIDIRR